MVWLRPTLWEFILNSDGVTDDYHIGGGFIFRHRLVMHLANGFTYYGSIDSNTTEARAILDGLTLHKSCNIEAILIQ